MVAVEIETLSMECFPSCLACTTVTPCLKGSAAAWVSSGFLCLSILSSLPPPDLTAEIHYFANVVTLGSLSFQ